MTALNPPEKLLPLIEYLDGLQGRASIDRLQELLGQTGATLEDLKPYVQFGNEHYQRNLLSINEWYEILVICWQSGQRSPIHNHAQSTCGLKVIEGVCTETVFDHLPGGGLMARHTTSLGAGHICASQDADTHQISNLQGRGKNLVTLHIYSPPLRSMQRFSLTGGQVEEWRPMVFEFAQGAGI